MVAHTVSGQADWSSHVERRNAGEKMRTRFSIAKCLCIQIDHPAYSSSNTAYSTKMVMYLTEYLLSSILT